MRRTNVQTLGEILRDFFEDNPEIYEKIMEARIERMSCSPLRSVSTLK